MYQNNKSNKDFVSLTLWLKPTGNQSPKYEYKANAESLFICSATKQKYKLSQINEWYQTEAVQRLVKQGFTGKWFAKTQQIETPKPYNKGNIQMVLSFIMTKPYKTRTDNVDGLKPISQAIPTYATQFAPDHAQPVDSMSDMDDEIPF